MIYMNKTIEKENKFEVKNCDQKIKIEDLIYEINGKQIMFDSDLAKLYGTETKRINEAVIRNKEKFPERFSWKLSDEEIKTFLVANCDQKIETRGGRYKNPRVFTEQGVAMLTTILKTKIAIQTSIAIMDAFVEMRKYISSNLINQDYYNNMVIKHDNEINLLKETFDKFQNKQNNNNGLFYEGQIYDSYSLLIDIFNESTKSIIIINNYIDKQLLDILKETKKNITIITNKYNNNDIEKYKEQYNNISIQINNKFHDRFIIIDNQILYHCGASFKDLGKKCFAITKIENKEWLTQLLKLI